MLHPGDAAPPHGGVAGRPPEHAGDIRRARFRVGKSQFGVVVRTRSGRKCNRACRIHLWMRRFFLCGKTEGACNSNKCLRCLCGPPRRQRANRLPYQPFQKAIPTDAVRSIHSPRRRTLPPMLDDVSFSEESCGNQPLSVRGANRTQPSFASWCLVMKRMSLEYPKAIQFTSECRLDSCKLRRRACNPPPPLWGLP